MTMVSLPGVTLYVEQHGSGEPLLLLHGLGSSGADWEEVLPALACRYRVILPDVRGHGRSEKPDGAYSVPLFAADLAALCDWLELKRAHVVGISMGGMIAFELAVTRPDLVASLCIVNSGPDMVPRNLKLKLQLALRVFLLRILGPARLATVIVKKLFPRPEQAHLREGVYRRLAANDRDVYLRATRGLIGWSVLDRISNISCPTLILASDRDYTSVAVKREYAAKLQNARVQVIEDSGHASPADQPDKVGSAILEFLDGVHSQAKTVSA
jgi:3-oxoadipate enol-lactonase